MIQIERCATFEKSPDDGIYMRRMTPADVMELARSLEGAEEVDTQVMSMDGFSRCVIPINWMKRGRYLVIPLKEDG